MTDSKREHPSKVCVKEVNSGVLKLLKSILNKAELKLNIYDKSFILSVLKFFKFI